MGKPYTEKDIIQVQTLAANLEKLHELYLEARTHIVLEVLKYDLVCCSKCERMMLPRRLWAKVTPEVRQVLRKHLTRTGARSLCGACHVTKHRNKPMTDKTLLRLRREVGLIT